MERILRIWEHCWEPGIAMWHNFFSSRLFGSCAHAILTHMFRLGDTALVSQAPLDSSSPTHIGVNRKRRCRKLTQALTSSNQSSSFITVLQKHSFKIQWENNSGHQNHNWFEEYSFILSKNDITEAQKHTNQEETFMGQIARILFQLKRVWKEMQYLASSLYCKLT